jgi:hypothetical protein
MVEALRCWIEAFQIAARTESKWKLSAIGSLIFDPTDGLDPIAVQDVILKPTR